MPQSQRFAFGKNWGDFVAKHLSEERINIARDSMLGFLRRESLSGLSFIDVGCGSGIHSLAALRAGAERVVSFDYDPQSVATSRAVWEHAGGPQNWQILQGDVLDRDFLASLGTADVVYSWGVLHHTGEMWTAIGNASRLMRDDGVFFVALYIWDHWQDPEYWLAVKQAYNRASWLGKRALELGHVWRNTLRHNLLTPMVAIKTIVGYKKSRGMAYYTDVKDWLGGWPMEFARVAELRERVEGQMGLELLHADGGGANAEYLLRRRGATNYWDDLRAEWVEATIDAPFERRQGATWCVPLSELAECADCADHPRRSTLLLLEDGAPLGPRHAQPQQIETYGSGAYLHWQGELIFSTRDNSDPNSNGRTYTWCLT